MDDPQTGEIQMRSSALMLGYFKEPEMTREAFTADDILRVATLTVLDLSEDGRRVAASVRRLRDNAVTDHRRYGDPTYVAPSMVELLVIDTRSGAIERPATGLLNIRQAAWNRAGDRLALLTAAESAANPGSDDAAVERGVRGLCLLYTSPSPRD